MLCPKVQSSTSLIYAIELKQLSLRSDIAAWSEQGSKRNQMKTNTADQAIKIVDSIEKQSLLIMAIGIDWFFFDQKKEVSSSKSLHI